MRFFKMFAVAALLCCAGPCRTRQGQAGRGLAEENIFRYDDTTTTSRLARQHRTCMSAQEWVRADRVQQAASGGFGREGAGNVGGTPRS